ncbi:MAG: peroxiredoxin [bacterium]|nr:peroxiredoxin [bacterium]
MSVKLGEQIPEIALLDQNNQVVSLREKIGNPLVVYFYPKDFTPGCTMEACSFRDNYNRIKEKNAEVIGISSDSPESHTRFAKKYNLEYILLSDSSKKAEKLFGVKRNLFGALPGRETFVFDKNGALIKHISSAINPLKHVDQSIKALEELVAAV